MITIYSPLYEELGGQVSVAGKKVNDSKRGWNSVNPYQIGETGRHGVAYLSIFGMNAMEKTRMWPISRGHGQP